MRPHLRTLALSAALISLSACADGAGDGDAAPAANPADSPAANAADSVAAEAAPPAEPMALTAGGLGTAAFGGTPQQVNQALGGAVEMRDDPAPCHYLKVRGMPGVGLMVENGRVVRADVDSAAPATDRGVRVGDSGDRVRALHGTVRSMPHKYTNGAYLVAFPLAPADTMHRLVFETDSAGVVTSMRGGSYPQVEWVEGCS